nr:hypothetical protein CFP56_79471 [Quercus suber]
MPATDKASVLKNVALAWVYVLDTLINSVYTTLFALGWFVLLAQHLNEPVAINAEKAPGTGTMDDAAGFTNPKVNATKVDIVAAPAKGALAGQEAVAYPSAGSTNALSGALFQSGSMASLTVLGVLWIIRIYFCIVVLSHARIVVRRYIASASTTAYASSQDATMAENPFRADCEDGAGWRGKLGRSMLKLPSQRYWLGKDESEEEWVRATSGRFEGGEGKLRINVPEQNGVGERERRARSGTGPPAPLKVKAPQ